MPLSQKSRMGATFSAPVAGQSLTDKPKNSPWEHAPQFTKLEDVMNFFMDNLTEPQHLVQLLQMIESKLPIEAIVRTLLFTGFTAGKFSVDLAILAYKPLMLTIIALAHRAGLKESPVLMPRAVSNTKKQQLRNYLTSQQFGKEQSPLIDNGPPPTIQDQVQPQGNRGFMQKANS